MTDIPYGWKCPQCSVIHAPWQQRCPSCLTPKEVPFFNPSRGYTATFTFKGDTFSSGSGAAFYSPPQKSEPVRAREVVNTWHEGGNSIRALVDAAITALVDEASEEEEDED